jgi:hypothetical protein
VPSKRIHLKFDEYLKAHSVILDFTFAESVHNRMDKGVKKFGADHQLIDFYHSEEGIREWLRGMTHLASQYTLTDYLRVALGHLVLDDMKYRFPEKKEGELVRAAYRSFVQRGFHQKYFKVR